jgi:predicted outer membrane repeat protein
MVSVVFFLSLAMHSCSRTPTSNLLDGSFLPSSGATLRFSTPATFLTYTETSIAVEARSGTGGLLPGFNEPVTLSVVGTGSLEIVSETAFSAGRKEIRIRYLKNITIGQFELISLRATSSSGVTGASDGLVALPPTFNITVPSTANPTQSFSLTISARSASGGADTAFNGDVRLGIENAVGALTPSQLTLSSGTATANVTFTGTPNSRFRITATAVSTSQMTGISSDICMGCGPGLPSGNDRFLNPIAVPVSATQLRLSWNRVPDVFGYKIYRKQSGSFVQQGGTLGQAVTFYNDTGLTPAQTYDYRIDAVNASDSVLATGIASGIPAACTTSVASDITSPTTWNMAQSPVCLTASIAVTGSGSLEIGPGVAVLFSPGVALTVSANYLRAIGTNSQPIILTSAHATDPTANRWGNNNAGIIIAATAQPTLFSADGNFTYQQYSSFQYVIVEYAKRALNVNSRGASAEFSIFRHNRVLDAGLDGTALHAKTNGAGVSSHVLRGNVFNNNSYGAVTNFSAVYLNHDGGASHAQLVENNVFSANVSEREGGGLYYSTGSIALARAEIKGNYFTSNSCAACIVGGWGGGGAYILPGFNMTYTISKNCFEKNSAAATGANGGGLYANGNNRGGVFSFVIEDNTFISNTANSSGGGLYYTNIASATHYIRRNLFRENSATYGGALALVNNGDNATIQQNSFLDNTATVSGGAIYLQSGSNGNTLSRNYFSANYSPAVSFNGMVRNNDNGNTNTWTGNSFVVIGLTTALFSNADTTLYSIGANNWWGQSVTGTACDSIAPTGICSTSAAGNPTFAAQLTSAPALCTVAPTDPDCVGAP